MKAITIIIQIIFLILSVCYLAPYFMSLVGFFKLILTYVAFTIVIYSLKCLSDFLSGEK